MRVLVVGASGAIGAEIAQELMADGHLVIPHCRRGRRSFTSLQWYQTDLHIEKYIQDMVQSQEPEILVNCAGVSYNARVQKLKIEDWEDTMDINLRAPFLLTKHALPAMVKAGYGRIIHLSSMASHLPLYGASAYAASKGGLEAFVRTVAVEIGAAKNVTINCVAPGPLDVGMGAELEGRNLESFLNRIPSKKLGSVTDVVSAVRYLIDAPYVTGQSIHVDGGMW